MRVYLEVVTMDELELRKVLMPSCKDTVVHKVFLVDESWSRRWLYAIRADTKFLLMKLST